MFIRIFSAANSGLQSTEIGVEVGIMGRGLPSFDIVGLAAKAVDESKERVRAGINNSGINFPARRIIVNLTPADIPKEGSCYDLPIAVGILCSVLNLNIPEKSLFFGELSLDGSLRHTKGALLLALLARERGFKNIFLPRDSANEAAIIKGINVYAIENLIQLIDFLTGKIVIQKAEHISEKQDISYEFDMQEVLGQEMAKRALEIAAAGGHNIFMVGGPGSGKTMLARALPGILPPLKEEESLEVTKIYSASGNIPPGGSLIQIRPFRAPHHTISTIALIGGGSRPRPGEITLAHRGVLFLDELNEFPRSALEALRQPMEDGYVNIARSRESIIYPAQYMFVASANPCPCGYFNHPIKNCVCTEREREKYRKKVSGPILDRLDMNIEVPDVEKEKLSLDSKLNTGAASSEKIRDRVEKARQVQKQRFKKEKILINAEMKNKHIEKYASLEQAAKNLLSQAVFKFSLSARAYFKVIKLARTIADLEESESVVSDHVAEALQYRLQDTGQT